MKNDSQQLIYKWNCIYWEIGCDIKCWHSLYTPLLYQYIITVYNSVGGIHTTVNKFNVINGHLVLTYGACFHQTFCTSDAFDTNTSADCLKAMCHGELQKIVPISSHILMQTKLLSAHTIMAAISPPLIKYLTT